MGQVMEYGVLEYSRWLGRRKTKKLGYERGNDKTTSTVGHFLTLLL
jgi:hypothetical protein